MFFPVFLHQTQDLNLLIQVFYVLQKHFVINLLICFYIFFMLCTNFLHIFYHSYSYVSSHFSFHNKYELLLLKIF